MDSYHEGLAGFCEDCLHESAKGPDGIADKKILGKKIRGKYGFINKQGEVAIAPKFDLIQWFENGRAKVWIGDRAFFIDKAGNEVSSRHGGQE